MVRKRPKSLSWKIYVLLNHITHPTSRFFVVLDTVSRLIRRTFLASPVPSKRKFLILIFFFLICFINFRIVNQTCPRTHWYQSRHHHYSRNIYLQINHHSTRTYQTSETPINSPNLLFRTSTKKIIPSPNYKCNKSDLIPPSLRTITQVFSCDVPVNHLEHLQLKWEHREIKDWLP